MAGEDYSWLLRGLEPEVQPEYLAQKERNEAMAIAEEDAAIAREEAEAERRREHINAILAEHGLPLLTGGGAESQELRSLWSTDPESSYFGPQFLQPDFVTELDRNTLMAAEGGVVPQFGGGNMDGITIGPARRRMPRPGMMETGIGMRRSPQTIPYPGGNNSGITMGGGRRGLGAVGGSYGDLPGGQLGGGGGSHPIGMSGYSGREMAPLPGIWGGPPSTDTVPAMLTPGEGVLNRGAMAMIGEGPVNALNRYGRGFEEGGIVDDRSEEQLIRAGHMIYHPKTQEEADALPTGAYFKTPGGEIMRVLPESKGMLLEEGGIVPGYAGGTGSVEVSGRSPRRGIGRGEFTRTDYGPGMPRLGRSPADLKEFTGSYGNKLGPNDVAVHPNNPFGAKPGPNEMIYVDGEWKHVADYMNQRLDPKKIDFYNPKQPELEGGFGGRRGPVSGSGSGGGGWGGSTGGGGGLGGWGGSGSGYGGSFGSGISTQGGGNFGQGGVGAGQVIVGIGNPLPAGPSSGDLKRPWWMEEGGIVPGYAEGTPSVEIPAGGPQRGIGRFFGGGFGGGPIGMWLNRNEGGGGQPAQPGPVQSLPSFSGPNWRRDYENAGGRPLPPVYAPGMVPGETLGPRDRAAIGGGSGPGYGWAPTGGPGWSPLPGAGAGTPGMGGSLNPLAGMPSQGFNWKPFLDKMFAGRTQATAGVESGGIVMEDGVVPSFAEGGVVPIGYSAPIEEQEWQKLVQFVPANVDIAKLREQADKSGISADTLMKLFSSMGGAGSGGGTSSGYGSGPIGGWVGYGG